MNKTLLILVIVILLMPLSALAEIHGNVEFGYDAEKEFEFADLNIEYIWEPLVLTHTIYGGIKTYFRVEGLSASQIFRSIFTIGTVLQYKGFYIRLNHFCSHPVLNTGGWVYDEWERYFWDSAGTQISVGFKW